MTALALMVIAVKHVASGLKEKLQECMFFFHEAGYRVSLEEKTGKVWSHLFCRLADAGPGDYGGKTAFKGFLAKGLTAYVLQEEALSFLREHIAHNYFYFPQKERDYIENLALRRYAADPAKDEGGQVFAEVQQCLQDYFSHYDYVNVDGLIRFRLRMWLKYLRKTLDLVVDDFLLEKEYQEFIKLLKYFVSLQDPKTKQIHVVLNEDGSYLFYDHAFQPALMPGDIQWESFDDLTGSRDDQLVSALVIAAPQRIVLHGDVYLHYPKAVDTLQHVFEDRLVLCKRCKLCQEVKKHTPEGKNMS